MVLPVLYVAVDGFSRTVGGMITIPIKNSVSIYAALMHPMLLQYELWQQVQVDHDTEFTLVVAVWQHLVQHRQWQDRCPTLQNTSTRNHRVERMWHEIN